MNNTVYYELVHKIKKKHPFPKQLPPDAKLTKVFLSESLKRLITKYLYCNDNLLLHLNPQDGISTRLLCEKSGVGSTVIVLCDLDKTKYNNLIYQLWNYKHRIIPINMNISKGIEYIESIGVRPNFILYNKALDNLRNLAHYFPDTLFILEKSSITLSRRFLKTNPDYRLEKDAKEECLIPNIQKYDLGVNYGLLFKMVSANISHKEKKLAIIIPLLCDVDVCDMEKIMCKHYKNFEKALKLIKRKYKVFYINQVQDGRPINIGKLLNSGYQIANKEGYELFLFQPSNLIPKLDIMDYYNTYPNEPISFEDNIENYNLGCMLFTKEDFKKCNGYTNDLWGKIGYDYSLWLRMATNGMTLGQITKGYFYRYKDSNKLSIQDDFIIDDIYKKHWSNWENDGLIDLQFTILKKKVIYKHISLYELNLKDFEYYLAPIKDMVFPISYYNKPVPYKWNLQFGDRPTPPMEELVGDPDEYLKFLKMYNKYHKEPLDDEVAELVDVTSLLSRSHGIFLKKGMKKLKTDIILIKKYHDKKFMDMEKPISYNATFISKFKYLIKNNEKNILITRLLHGGLLSQKILNIFNIIYSLIYFFKNNLLNIDVILYITELEMNKTQSIKEYTDYLTDELNKFMKIYPNFKIEYKVAEHLSMKEIPNKKYDIINNDLIMNYKFWETYSILEYNTTANLIFILLLIKKYLKENGNFRFFCFGISNKILLDIILLLANSFNESKMIKSMLGSIKVKNYDFILLNYKNNIPNNIEDIYNKILESNKSMGHKLFFDNKNNKYGLKNYNKKVNKNYKYITNLIDYNLDDMSLLIKNIFIFNYDITNLYKRKIKEYYSLKKLFETISKKKKIKLIKDINIEKHKVLYSIINVYEDVKNLLNNKKFKEALKIIEEYKLQLNTTQFDLENGNTLYHFIAMNIDKIKKNKILCFDMFADYEEPKEIKNQFNLTYKDYLNYNILFK